MPPDPRDIRVLIPEVRRAIDGPTATSSAAVSSSLDDNEVKNLIADSIADVILYTGGTSGVFGKKLVVTSVDGSYGAPDEWQTDPELELTERRVVVAQAGLNYFFMRAKELKVSEEISDEGQTWRYQFSSTLIRDQMKFLQEQRDAALVALSVNHPALEQYASYVQVRDSQTAALIEPWAGGSGGAWDTSLMGGQDLDPRGFY